MSIADCILIKLPEIKDSRGNLSFIESNKNIPFEIKRIYYIYEVPVNQERAAHAHKELNQIIFCLSGSLEIVLDDGSNKKTIILDSPSEGLFMSSKIWRDIKFCKKSSLCMVVADQYYDENDYIREYELFKNFLQIN